MSLSTMKSRLLPCDTNHPYVFISYSSHDSELVWEDVLELQACGYNVWIDEANLDKSKPSWKDDALRAIEDVNCALLLFYVSKHSLTSRPCSNELDTTTAEATLATHLGKLDFVAVDVDDIGNIGRFISDLGNYISESDIPHSDKTDKMCALYNFSKKWFPDNNEKVRIHAKSKPGRVGDYLTDIENTLAKSRRDIRLPATLLMQRISAEKSYRIAIDYIISNQLDKAVKFLELGIDSHLPSAFMYAHFCYTGTPSMPADIELAKSAWEQMNDFLPMDKWKTDGIDYDLRKYYSEAIAYLTAYAEAAGSAESFYHVAKLWIKKGCRQQALIAFRSAIQLGYRQAVPYYERFNSVTDSKVFEFAYKDEAPIK